mgnify:CR=1 FL=1
MTQEIKQRIEQIKKGKVPAGYKKSKLGIVSSEWENTSFSTLFTTTSDFTEDNAKYPLYSLTIENGITAKTERYERSFLVKKNNSYKIMQPNDFAYNPMNIRFGAVARHKGTKAVSVSGYYDIFTTVNQSDLQFMDDFLSSDLMLTYYNKQSTGSLIEKKRVHFSQFLDFNLPLPPLSERKKIAEILSTQDKVIELQQKRIDELKKLKKAYLNKMFPQKESNVPELRFKGFTGNWEQRKLGDIVGIYDGVHQTPNYQDSGVMFLSVENIATLKSSKFISEEDFKRDYKVYPQENDILMTRIGDVGTTNVVTDNGLKAYYVSLALLKYKKTDPYFLSNAIQSDFVQKGLANRTLKTAVPMKINKDEIGKVDVMLPVSPEEQHQIGSYFQNLDNLITLQSRKLDAEKLKKKSLMQLLLTGIVRVK